MTDPKRKRRILAVRLISLFVILTVCVAAFVFSGEDGESSSRASDRVFDAVSKIGQPDHVSASGKETYRSRLVRTSFLRKSGHAFEYLILGFSSAVFALSFLPGPEATEKKRSSRFALLLLFAFLFCVLYAASDEIHQWFVPGRDGAFKDVLLDAVSAFTGLLVAAGICDAVPDGAQTSLPSMK